nr:phosphatidylinositol 4-phosphate 5-kinase 7-like isoform X2 [Hydra vulgaris]
MTNQESGVYVFPNGDRYAGDYSHRSDGSIMRQGIGQYTSKDGLICKGIWSDDKLNGIGEVTFTSGAAYEGMFVNNCMHGNGRYKFPDGSVYEDC